MGILNSVAKFGTPGAAGFFHYYASLADSFPFVERHEPSSGGGVGLLVREPVGVVLAIVPWNAPLMLAALKLAPRLAGRLHRDPESLARGAARRLCHRRGG
jgi:aldehyde dehydrogenase (NAD+)